MKILKCIKRMLRSEEPITTFAEDLELYKTLVESSPLVMYILDKNKVLIDIYNMNRVQNIGLPPNHVMIGKNLRYYADDISSPFHQICYILDEAIDKLSKTTPPITLKYKILDSYLKATVSKIQGERTLIQIQNITSFTQQLHELESSSYKELSMALTAGGLTSWSYDIKTKIISSADQNNIISDKITFDELLANVLPEYQQDMIKMYDDIINQQSQHREITVKVKDISGKILWANVHAIPYLYDSSGRLTVIAGSQKDVTKEYEYNNNINLLNKQNELIMNNMSSALVYITPDFRVIWENISKVFKGTLHRKYYATGTYCYTAFNRDTPCEHCVMRDAMQSCKTESAEFTTAEGLIIEILANPILGKSNTIEGIVLKIDDITEKKNIIQRLEIAEKEAVSVNRLLIAIMNNMSTSLFIKDASDDYRFIIANKQYCDSVGFSEKDIIGKTDYDLFSKKEADHYRTDDSATMGTNQTKVIEGEVVSTKNGVAIWHTIKTPFVYAEDNKKLLIGTALDVTENHKAYQELAIAKKKAEESDLLKSAFLANMSHEIRTPLNAIIGFSELLKDSENKDNKEEFWNIISTNNDLLLRLINDILDLSKIESGMVELKTAQFNLAERFNNIYSTLMLRNNNTKVEFICENPYNKCIVALDENRVTQIITNFVTNSFKFTPNGKIKMGYEYVDKGIRLYCTDTGIGIPPEKIDKVFTRFSKLDDFAQGTGLGTAICKAIVDAYGGKVGVNSLVNKGSTFWAWIPCEADINHATEQQIHTESSNNSPLNDFTSMKILVAEDNESNYLLVKSMLKGFDITRAINGAEAVEKVKTEHFNTVLMDIKMPIMGGLEATQEIRKFNKEIRIIALTANAFDSDKQDALDSGCNDFVAKPVNKTKLFEILRSE